jgi:hypothetical protein
MTLRLLVWFLGYKSITSARLRLVYYSMYPIIYMLGLHYVCIHILHRTLLHIPVTKGPPSIHIHVNMFFVVFGDWSYQPVQGRLGIDCHILAQVHL